MYGTLSISLPCCVAYHPLSPPQPSLAGIVDYYDTKETLYLVLELFVAPLNFLEGGILILQIRAALYTACRAEISLTN